MKREQIIATILQDHERSRSIDPEFAIAFAEEQGQAALDDLVRGIRAYPDLIVRELENRLTQSEYLTCVDFDHFDVKCCAPCHNGYPHYDMYDVTLNEGRHAWVCCPITSILMRDVKAITKPETEEKMRLLEKVFGGSTDALEEELHEANTAYFTPIDNTVGNGHSSPSRGSCAKH